MDIKAKMIDLLVAAGEDLRDNHMWDVGDSRTKPLRDTEFVEVLMNHLSELVDLWNKDLALMQSALSALETCQTFKPDTGDWQFYDEESVEEALAALRKRLRS